MTNNGLPKQVIFLNRTDDEDSQSFGAGAPFDCRLLLHGGLGHSLWVPLRAGERTREYYSKVNTVTTSHLEQSRLHKPAPFFTEPEGVLKMRARTPASSTMTGLMTNRRLNWSGQDRPNLWPQGFAVKRLWQEWQVGILADDFVHVCP